MGCRPRLYEKAVRCEISELKQSMEVVNIQSTSGKSTLLFKGQVWPFYHTFWFIIEAIGWLIFNPTWNFWVGCEQDCEPGTWQKFTKTCHQKKTFYHLSKTRFALLDRSMLRRSFVTCLINTNDSDGVCEHLGLVLSQIIITTFSSSII